MPLLLKSGSIKTYIIDKMVPSKKHLKINWFTHYNTYMWSKFHKPKSCLYPREAYGLIVWNLSQFLLSNGPSQVNQPFLSHIIPLEVRSKKKLWKSFFFNLLFKSSITVNNMFLWSPSASFSICSLALKNVYTWQHQIWYIIYSWIPVCEKQYQHCSS